MATRSRKSNVPANNVKAEPAKTEAKASLIFTPKFKTEKDISAAVDKVMSADKTQGELIHHVLVSCVAHDEMHRPTGGSVTTILNGAVAKFRQSTSIDINSIMRWLQAIYSDKLTWDKEAKKLRAKGLQFKPVIVQPTPDGGKTEVHYSELPFWKLAINQAIRNEPWSFIGQLETLLRRFEDPEMMARLGKKGDKAFDAKTEREVAITVRELVGLIKPDPKVNEVDKAKLKELTTFASIAKDNPQALHEAATRH